MAVALAGAAAPSTVSAKRSRSSELADVPSLEEIYPVWLEASPDERCAQPRSMATALRLCYARHLGQLLQLSDE